MKNTTPFEEGDYDEEIHKTIPFLTDIQRQIIDIVAASKIDVTKWLDIGCGTGELVAKSAHLFTNTSFTLCDTSAKMLHIAKEKLSSYKNTEFLHVPFQAADLSDKYDIITAVQVLHYCHRADRDKAIHKAYRLVKPNGMFITVNNTAPSSAYGTNLALERWRAFQQQKGQLPEDAEQHMQRYGRAYFPLSAKQQIEDLKAAGFKIVEVFWHSYIQVGIYAVK